MQIKESGFENLLKCQSFKTRTASIGENKSEILAPLTYTQFIIKI